MHNSWNVFCSLPMVMAIFISWFSLLTEAAFLQPYKWLQVQLVSRSNIKYIIWGSLLLIRIKLKPSADNYIHCIIEDEITCPFPNFNVAAVEVWEWMCNCIFHFSWHVIIYLEWNFTLIVKGPMNLCGLELRIDKCDFVIKVFLEPLI